MKRRMVITTMGRLSVSVDDRPLRLDLSPVRLELFASLLSPFDPYQRWERLAQILDEPDSGRRRCRLAGELFEISAHFIRHSGVDPLVMGDEGVTIDRSRVLVDVVGIVDSLNRALDCFRTGKREEGIRLAAELLPLLQGEYLPGIHGRIIDRTREDFDDLISIIRRHPDRHSPISPGMIIPFSPEGNTAWTSAV